MQNEIKGLDRDIQNINSTIEENNESITESYTKRLKRIEDEVCLLLM